jgi:hypothetical protein
MPALKSVALFLALTLFAVTQAASEDSAKIMACVDMFGLVMARLEDPSSSIDSSFEKTAGVCLPYIDRVLFKDYPACSGTDAKPDERRCRIATEAAQIYSDLMELKSKLDGLIFKTFPELFTVGPMLTDFPGELETDRD